MWDSDTLADEARGHGDIVEVITGRFPRNPPLYYEMRLKRVAEELKAHPEKLEHYDDAGVACDRLGRGDEAIGWMAKKRMALGRSGLPADHDHWYRYHANLGTFLAHKWFRDGKDFSNMADLQQGAEHIRMALKINPNAHFGREEYQLKFMEWVLAKPEVIKTYGDYDTKYLADFLQLERHAELPTTQWESISRGASGLIALGNAWESLDIFIALKRVHSTIGNSSIATLAESRSLELIAHGIKPVLGPELTSDTLYELLRPDEFAFTGEPEHPFDYTALRANADEWQEHRTAFMMQKLTAGQHPDTDPDFWTGYTEVPKPSLPLNGPELSRLKNQAEIDEINDRIETFEWIAGAVVLFLGGTIIWRRKRARQKLLQP